MRILTRTVLAVLAVAMTVGVAVDDRLQARQGRGGPPPAPPPPAEWGWTRKSPQEMGK